MDETEERMRVIKSLLSIVIILYLPFDRSLFDQRIKGRTQLSEICTSSSFNELFS